MDITNDISDINIGNKYILDDKSIKDVPVIAVFSSSKLVGLYSIKDNNYDVNLAKMFINNVSFLEEDGANG